MAIERSNPFNSSPSDDGFRNDQFINASDYKGIIKDNHNIYFRPWFRAPGWEGSFTTTNTSYTQVNDTSDEPNLSEWRPSLAPQRKVENGSTFQYLFRFHAVLKEIDVRFQVETLRVDDTNNQITRNSIVTKEISNTGARDNIKVTEALNKSNFEHSSYNDLLTFELQIEMKDNGSGTPDLSRWMVDAGVISQATNEGDVPRWGNH